MPPRGQPSSFNSRGGRASFTRGGASRGRGSGRGTGSGGRNFEHIASVSRSSGLEKDGDALKDFKTQEEYREFIQEKLNEFWKLYPYGKPASDSDSKRRIELQENLLILFRKLREGLVSSRRLDKFTLEVYETSFFLSAIFQNLKQCTLLVPYLCPQLYQQISPPHSNIRHIMLISLVHELIVAYPSQRPYFELLNKLSTFLKKTSMEYGWISQVSSSLRRHNHLKFEMLTRREMLTALFGDIHYPLELDSLSSQIQSNRIYIVMAFLSQMDLLRAKCRETSWTILRSAYRELACNEGSPTRDWLFHSLVLNSVASEDNNVGKEVDQWLADKSSLGQVKSKEGIEGRWVICKLR